MVIRIISLFFIFTNISLSECFDHSLSIPKEINRIEISIPESKKFFKNIGEIYISREREIANKVPIEKIQIFNKKKYAANILINYKNNITCEFQAKLRFHGDLNDHVELINGYPISSLRLKLEDGNINGITRFKLLRPQSRNYDNEIFITSLLDTLDFLVPRTFMVDVLINNVKTRYIFQESLKKEFLENNRRVEGPIIETNEDWKNKILQMSKISNKEWIKKDYQKLNASLNAIKKHNLNLLGSYKNKIYFDSDLIELNSNKFQKSEFININIFDALMFALGASHGLTFDDRRFYYDPIIEIFEPLYYDGMSNILSVANYDKTKGIYNKSYLANWKKIKPLFTNYDLNKERSLRDRTDNPPVTISARNGAVGALSKLKQINIDEFHKKILKNGVKKISHENTVKVIDKIIERLEIIEKSKIIKNDFTTESNLYRKYEKEMSTNKNLFLIFLKEKPNPNENFHIEKCQYKIKECEIKKIDYKDVLKLVEQRKIGKDYSIFMNMKKSEYLDLENYHFKNNKFIFFKRFNLNKSINFYYNKSVNFKIDEEKKEIHFNFKQNKARIFFRDSYLDKWKIYVKNTSPENDAASLNEFNLTGCITLLDSKLNNVEIYTQDLNCEDSLNFIRSEGHLKKIEIDNSKSDGIDADFSKLNIENLIVKNSQNDCADFSFGEYNIKKMDLKNCGDKALSVGEKSNLKINTIFAENSNIGIASKDGSKVFVKKNSFKNMNTCFAAYNKKQEFYGGFIETESSLCENSLKKIELDKYSQITIK